MTNNKQYEEAFEVEFEIVNDNSSDNDRIIRGEPLYYTTGQVAEQLGEPDSTIRYWCDEFDEFLKIKKTGSSGKRRQFTSTDIKKIEYIKYLLKEENLSIRQVKEFLSTPEAEKMLPITKEKEQILLEALANTISSLVERLIDEKLNKMEKMLVEFAETYKANQEKFKEDLSIEIVKKMITQYSYSQETLKNDLTKAINTENQKHLVEINEIIKGFDKRLDERKKALLERDREVIEEIRKRLEEKKTEEKQKGFFSRIFGK